MGGSLHKWGLVHKGDDIEVVYMEVVGQVDYGSGDVGVMVVHKVSCEMNMEVDPMEVFGDVVRLEGVVVEDNVEGRLYRNIVVSKHYRMRYDHGGMDWEVAMKIDHMSMAPPSSDSSTLGAHHH